MHGGVEFATLKPMPLLQDRPRRPVESQIADIYYPKTVRMWCQSRLLIVFYDHVTLTGSYQFSNYHNAAAYDKESGLRFSSLSPIEEIIAAQ